MAPSPYAVPLIARAKRGPLNASDKVTFWTRASRPLTTCATLFAAQNAHLATERHARQRQACPRFRSLQNWILRRHPGAFC